MAVTGGRVAALDDPVGVSDMCLLEPLAEANFITNLKHRFEHDQLYVSWPCLKVYTKFILRGC